MTVIAIDTYIPFEWYRSICNMYMRVCQLRDFICFFFWRSVSLSCQIFRFLNGELPMYLKHYFLSFFFLLEYWRVKRMGLVTGLARARARMCRYVRLSILKYRKQQGIAINTHTHLFKASISFAAWHFSCHLQFSWFFFSQILIENSSICPTFSSFFSSLQRSRISLKAFHVQKHYRLKKISIYYYQCIRFTMYIVQTSGIKQQQQQHPIGFAQHSM